MSRKDMRMVIVKAAERFICIHAGTDAVGGISYQP